MPVQQRMWDIATLHCPTAHEAPLHPLHVHSQSAGCVRVGIWWQLHSLCCRVDSGLRWFQRVHEVEYKWMHEVAHRQMHEVNICGCMRLNLFHAPSPVVA
jgi:hypothetical protein